MTISVEVKLVGFLAELAGRTTFSVKLTSDEHVAVKDVVHELADSLPQSFKQVLVDPELDDPRPNVLVLLNSAEIGALNGLKTKVRNGDKMVLIPVSHGG